MTDATFRCLIVEDNFIIRTDLEDMVRTSGFETIDQASSLAEASESIKKTRFDIVLLDLRLGGQDTGSLVKLLKSRKIPFAITTGYAIRADDPCLLQGVPVIPKPYAVETVTRVLREMMRLPNVGDTQTG